jgi:hypothetical protein
MLVGRRTNMALDSIEITDFIAASIRFETVAPPEKFQRGSTTAICVAT